MLCPGFGGASECYYDKLKKYKLVEVRQDISVVSYRQLCCSGI